MLACACSRERGDAGVGAGTNNGTGDTGDA
jgi:hypothetical protein